MNTHWQIPAKTFLLGEYAALNEGRAILLTTEPCFTVTLTQTPGLHGIHPDSPAGIWWSASGFNEFGLSWLDPYHGLGGMGASSAQFLGAFLATSHLTKHPFSQNELLQAYWKCAWSGQGHRPSGYDLIAQSLSDCVLIHRQENQYKTKPWPFKHLSFLLVHTRTKLATHSHLQSATIKDTNLLNTIAEKAFQSFEQRNDLVFIDAINAYHKALLDLNLVHENTQHLIKELSQQHELLAAKGCGAMGADVILLVMQKETVATMKKKLTSFGLTVLASVKQLHIPSK